MKTAWVFEGGGLNGAASCRQALRVWNTGSRPSIFTGDSIGAVLAYLIALEGSPAKVDEIWDTLERRDFYSGGSWLDKLAVALGKRRGLYDMRPSLETLTELVRGRHLPHGVIVVVTTADLKWGIRREVVLTDVVPPERCIEAVYHSTLVPLAHGADGGRWADGGIYGGPPVAPAVRAGAEHVELFLLNRLGPAYAPWNGGAPLDEAARSISMMREALIARDLESTYARNRYPQAGDRSITARVWEPLDGLPDWMDASKYALGQRRRCRFKPHDLGGAVQMQERRRLEQLAASLQED